jgi:hypothetical protein
VWQSTVHRDRVCVGGKGGSQILITQNDNFSVINSNEKVLLICFERNLILLFIVGDKEEDDRENQISLWATTG